MPDEVEQLRAEIDKLEAQCLDYASRLGVADRQRDSCRLKNERLRTALKAIANAPNHQRGDWYEMVEWMRSHARSAIESKEPKE